MSEDIFTKIDVPADGSCLFWASTLAYLYPVRYDSYVFPKRFERLFGNTHSAQQMKIVQKLIQQSNSVHSIHTDVCTNEVFQQLVTDVLRNRVIDEICSHESEFQESVTINDFLYSKNEDYVIKGTLQDNFRAQFGFEICQYNIDLSVFKPSAFNESAVQLIDKETDKVPDQRKVKEFKLKEYSKCMRDIKAWGGHHEMQALSQVLQCSIHVFSESTQHSISYNDSSDQVQLFNNGECHYNFGLIKASFLINVIKRNKLQEAQYYIKFGIDDINYKDYESWTPLHFAAQHGDTNIIQTLLAQGASTNVQNNLKQIPVDVARLFDKHSAVSILSQQSQTTHSSQSDFAMTPSVQVQQQPFCYDTRDSASGIFCAKTNERLKVFIEYFVKEFEIKLYSYHLILKEVEKAGKLSNKFVGFVQQASAKNAGVKFLESLGATTSNSGQKICSKLESTHQGNKFSHLLDLIDCSQKDKEKFRNILATAAFDIFQSFEMQFMNVTTRKGANDAMYKLAKDAANRALNHMKNGNKAFVSESFALGKSKKPAGNSLSPGYEISYVYQSNKRTWNTASLFEKAGVLLTQKGKSFYKKNGFISDTGKYGYRRLFSWENWNELDDKYVIDDTEGKSRDFLDHKYVLSLKDAEEKSKTALAEIYSDSDTPSEEAVHETIEEIRDDILQEIRLLRKRSHGFTEDRKILQQMEVKVKGLKMDICVKRFKQYFKGLKQVRREIIKLVRGDNQDANQPKRKLVVNIKEPQNKNEAKTVEENVNIVKKETELENTGGEITQVYGKQVGEKVSIWFDVREPLASFSGRKEQLDYLASHTRQGIVVISGASGVGKSELAVSYAHKMYNKHDNIVWINAESRDTIRESFHRLSERLSYTMTKKERRNATFTNNYIYQYFSDRKSIFVFDNAENYTAIKEFLPLSLPNELCIVVTSVSSFTEMNIKTLSLNCFTTVEAIQFVEDVIGSVNISKTEDIANLTNELHNFPLALQLAAIYIKEKQKRLKNVDPSGKFTVAEFLEEINKSTGDLQKYEAFSEISGEYNMATFVVFKVILNEIMDSLEDGEQIVDMINVMSYFSAGCIPTNTILTLANNDERTFNCFTQQLKKYSVIRNEKNLNMHSLLKQTTRLYLQKQTQGAQMAEENVLEKALKLLKYYLEDYNISRSYISHVTSVWKYASKYDTLIERFIVRDIGDKTTDTTYFHLIAESSCSEVIEVVVKKLEENHSNILGKIINEQKGENGTPLHNAALGGNERIIQLLTNKGGIVNTEKKHKWTPLHVATKRGFVDAVSTLLDNGGRTDCKTENGFTPLHLSAKYGHKNIVDLLLKKDADVHAKTDNGFTPLHFAASCGCADLVATIQDKEIEDSDKFPAFRFTKNSSHVEIVEALTDRGADPDAPTHLSRTSLHLAAENAFLEIVRVLLSKGATVDAKDINHFTPLHLAVMRCHTEVINNLINNNANIDAQTVDGNTPLHLAAENGHLQIVKDLITKGATYDIKNKEGKTALDLLNETNQREIKDYITKKRADQKIPFDKRPGTSGDGQFYEIGLAMLFLLQGIMKKEAGHFDSFYLATNMEEAGNFDDIVFKYTYKDQDGAEKAKVIFFQAKHKKYTKKEKLTWEKLISKSENKGDFNLKDYFRSYRKIKEQFTKDETSHPIFGKNSKDLECDFIIYTNASLRENEERDHENITKVTLENDSALFLEKSNHYYQISFTGDKKKDITDVLEYSSDCKKLATELVKSVYSGRGIDMNKFIFKDYHMPMAEKVIKRKKGKEGEFYKDFISGHNLSEKEMEFRNTFFEEVKTFTKESNNSNYKIMQELQRKSIKLSDKFGIEDESGADTKCPELPSDPVGTDEIHEFLGDLKLFVGQPNETELGNILKRKIQAAYSLEKNDVNTVFSEVRCKVEKWWKESTQGNHGKEESYYLRENNRFFHDSVRISVLFDIKDPVELFTGRKKELDQLHESLQRNQDKNKFTLISQVTSVSGLGGIGKTELARKYIHEYCQSYDNNVVWVNAENYGTLAESFRRLAQNNLRISLKNVDGKEKDVQSIVAEVYKFFAKRRSLFVFDNAEKYKTEEGEDAGIDKFLPPASSSDKLRVLITSRSQEWETMEILSLGIFTEEEAAEFIRKALFIERGSQENEIKQIAATLQHFPLALQQAVAYIRQQDEKSRNVGEEFCIADYLEEYENEKMKVQLLDFNLLGNNDYTRTTFITWKITLEKIKQMDYGDEALDIMDIIAYFAPDNISTKIFFNRISDKRELGSALQLLKQYSMISLEQGEANVHRLVQEVTRIDLKEKRREREVLRDALNLLSVPLEESNPTGSIHTPHAVSSWDHACEYKELVKEFSGLPGEIITNLVNGVRYEEAHIFGKKVLKLLRNVIGREHLSTLTVEVSMATVLDSQGKHDEAWSAYRNIFDKFNDILGSDHPYTIRARNNMAVVLDNRGKYEEALTIYQEVLEKQKQTLGDDHADTLTVLNNIAVILNNKGNYDEALLVYQEIFDKRKEILGTRHPDTLDTKNNVAEVLESLGLYDEALLASQEVYDIRKEVLGAQHPHTLGTKNNIAGILINLGKYDEALTSFEHIVNSFEEILGTDHPSTLNARTNVAEVLGLQGKLDDALRIYQETSYKLECTLGPDHPDTLKSMNDMAHVLSDMGDNDRALSIFREVFRRQKQVLGCDHPDTLTTLNGLASVLCKQQKFQSALKAYQTVYDQFKRTLGPDHPFTLDVRNNMAVTFSNLGKHREALQAYQEVLDARKEVYPDHPNTLYAMHNIAIETWKQGEGEKALQALNELYEKTKNLLGTEHPVALSVLKSIAKVQSNQ